jgi:hypothetical protein
MELRICEELKYDAVEWNKQNTHIHGVAYKIFVLNNKDVWVWTS